MRRGLTVCALGAVLITASVLVTRHALTQVCSVSDHWFETSDGTWIYGRLYVPIPPPPGPVPGIVAAHGYMANLAMVELPLVRPLVQRGFVVLSLDRRGHGRSGGRLWPPPPPPRIRLQDFDPGLQAGIQFLRTQPAVDPMQIGLVGFEPSGDKEILFKRATDGHAGQLGELVGNLAAGDARLLVTIPGAGHVTALFSPAAVRQTTEWLTRSFPAAPVRKAALPEQSPPYAWLIVGLAGALLVMTGVVAALPGSSADVAGFLGWCPLTSSWRAEEGNTDIKATTAQAGLSGSTRDWLVQTDSDDASTVSSAGIAPLWFAAFWLVYRGVLFELGMAAATRIAQLADSMLVWVPLDGAHWFVALPWGMFIGLWVTTPFALLTPTHWRDAYGRLQRLGWKRCLWGIGLGVPLGLVGMVALSIAVTGWYEGFPSPAKLVTFGILFPALFAPLVGLDVWVRAVLPAGLALSAGAERWVALLILATAPCAFLIAGLPLWPGIVYVPYYLTAVELGVGVLLLGSGSLSTRPFAGASALAVVATWMAVVVCPLY